MFKVKTTGKNKNYGKCGEQRFLADNFVMNAVKKGWIEKRIEYVGNYRVGLKVIPVTKYCKECGGKL